MEAQPWKMVLQCYLSDVIRQFADKGAEHEFQKEKDTENYIVDHHLILVLAMIVPTLLSFL